MENIDFLPERVKARRAGRKRLFRQGCLLLSCVAVLIALAWTRHERICEANQELALVSERAAGVERKVGALGNLQQRLGELMIKKNIHQQLGGRVGVLDVLVELESLLPKDVVMTSLNLEAVDVRQPARTGGEAGLRRGGARPSGGRQKEQIVTQVRLDLTGLAPTDGDLGSFIAQLSLNPLFEKVHMGYSRNTVFEDRSAREFKVSCYIVR